MNRKQQSVLTGIIVMAVAAAMPASGPNATGVSTQMVITVKPIHGGNNMPEGLQARDVTVVENHKNVPVVRLQRLAGDLAECNSSFFWTTPHGRPASGSNCPS